MKGALGALKDAFGTTSAATVTRTSVTADNVVEAISQQFDGLPGVAFRMTTKDSDPIFDIPNGAKIRCLREDGEWLAVEYIEAVGFVKRRNVIDMFGACTPIHQLSRVTIVQADGHAGVAFRPGKCSAEPSGDIPNGTELACLLQLGGFVVVDWHDVLGFVKDRNTVVLSES